MMINNQWLTICTPTYNRANTLLRVYESLKRQSVKNFVWLIIDDGSIDDTKEIVKDFKEDADFQISYVYKNNGGKHTALNLAYTLIDTEFVLNLDSDDELTNNAIESLQKAYEVILSRDDYDKIWVISGRCIDSQTLKPISKEFPKNINELSNQKQHKEITKVYGEKCNCRKVAVLKKYPFPVYPELKFIPEDIIWETINKNYNQYCINDYLRIYHTDSIDSLCKGNVHAQTKWKSIYLLYIFYINECFDQIFYNKKCLYAILDFYRCSINAGISFKSSLKEINSLYKIIIIILFSVIGSKVLAIREKIKKVSR